MGPPPLLPLPPFPGDSGPEHPTLPSTLPFFGDPPLRDAGSGSGSDDDDAPLSALSVRALLSLLLLLLGVDTTVGVGGICVRGYRAEQHAAAMCVAAGWEREGWSSLDVGYEYFSSVRHPGPPHVQGEDDGGVAA